METKGDREGIALEMHRGASIKIDEVNGDCEVDLSKEGNCIVQWSSFQDRK